MDEFKYDVFKWIPKKNPLWLGSVNGLERAAELMKRMATSLPGDYFVSSGCSDLLKMRLGDSGPRLVPRPPGLLFAYRDNFQCDRINRSGSVASRHRNSGGPMTRGVLCPHCKSSHPRLLKPRGLLEQVLGFLTISRYQCRACTALFYS